MLSRTEAQNSPFNLSLPQRLLSILLSFVLICTGFSVAPSTAFGETETPSIDQTVQTEVVGEGQDIDLTQQKSEGEIVESDTNSISESQDQILST